MSVDANGSAIQIHDYDDADYDPFTASSRLAGTDKVANLYPELARLRHENPVWEGDIRLHFNTAPDGTLADRRKITVLGHKEVTEILMNAKGIFSNQLYEFNLGKSFGRGVTVMDLPEHRHYRMLFQKAFLPKMVASWADTLVPAVIHKLVDKFERDGKANLASQFALHFPFQVINELLQLPLDHRPTFHKLAFGQTTMRFDAEHALEAGRKLRQYLIELVAERRRNPLGENDFITVLAEAEIDGRPLPEEDLISFLRQLMNAGGDTSYHGFTNVLTALLTHPEQLEAVTADRTLVTAAIDEGLRLECPVLLIDRTTTEEVVLGGVRVHPGDHLGVVLGSANRDELVYPEPDTFDISRKSRHYAFGAGAHICIGQHLARLELNTALNILLDRLPHLRLDPTMAPPEVTGLLIRGAKHVNVVFG